MAIKHMDGFDQLQGQSQAGLLSSLTSAGYLVTGGLAIAPGRNPDSYALEIQVSPGAAGESWSPRTNTIKNNLNGVATSPTGRTIAVGDKGSAVATNDDQTWLPLVVGGSVNLKDVDCNDQGTWIVVGENSTILKSTDGRNFSSVVAPLSGLSLRAVKFGGDVWVIVGANGAKGVILTSIDDGDTWGVAAGAGNAANLCVEYGAARWMIGGNAGQLIESTDGANFAALISGVTTPISGIANGDNKWLFVTGNDVHQSNNNGITWAKIMDNLIATGTLACIDFADGRWVVGGDGGNLYYSLDLIEWIKPQYSGAGTARINAVEASVGTRAGWRAVGNKVGTSTTAVALILVSLSPPNLVTRTLSTTQSKVVFGFAHEATIRGRIFSIKDLLDIDWPGPVTMLDQVGTIIPARNVTYYYEVRIDKGANTVELYINNVLDITAPLPPAGAAMTDYEVSWVSENGAITKVDDILFIDSSTSATEQIADRIGPVQIPMRLPTADVLTEWTPSSSAPHWAQVGMLPPSTESYVRSATSGAQELFESSDPLPPGAGGPTMPIFAVGLLVLAQKSDIDNRQLGLAVGQGANQSEVIDTQLSVTPEYSQAVFEKAPGDTPWTTQLIQDTPFGVIVRP